MATPSQPAPITRRNRRPTPEERAGILPQIETDTALLNILKNQLATRCASRDQAASKVDAATKNYEEAKNQLKTTRETLRTLEESLKVLLGSSSENTVPALHALNDPTHSIISDTPGISSEVSDSESFGVLQSLRIVATNKSLQRRVKVTAVIREKIEEAKKDLRDAYEAASTSHDNLECAISLHTAANAFIGHVRAYIQDMDRVLATHSGCLRSILYIPEDVWRHIFQLFIEDNDVCMIQPISVHVLVLSSVCYNWRSILQSNSAWWALVPKQGWASLDNISIPSHEVKLGGFLRSMSSVLTGLHTIELRGTAVDEWVLHLLHDKSLYHSQQPPHLFESLQNLIIVDYTGNGENILQLAEIRQALYTVFNGTALLLSSEVIIHRNLSHLLVLISPVCSLNTVSDV